MAISDTPSSDDDIWISITPQIAPRPRKDTKPEQRFALWGLKPSPAAPRDADRVVDAFRCSGQI
jgi:hypothetical protein